MIPNCNIYSIMLIPIVQKLFNIKIIVFLLIAKELSVKIPGSLELDFNIWGFNFQLVIST